MTAQQLVDAAPAYLALALLRCAHIRHAVRIQRRITIAAMTRRSEAPELIAREARVIRACETRRTESGGAFGTAIAMLVVMPQMRAVLHGTTAKTYSC